MALVVLLAVPAAFVGVVAAVVVVVLPRLMVMMVVDLHST